MRRTTASGNVANRYDAGNPALGVLATVVGATELTLIQEEIANVIEAEGITLDATGVTEDQMNTALDLKVAGGGSQVAFALANNVTVAADVTGLLFSSATIKGVSIEFYLSRKTDTVNLLEKGTIHLAYDPSASNWRISLSSAFDDAAAVFSVTAAGQVKYTSSNMAGANYVGVLNSIVRTIK